MKKHFLLVTKATVFFITLLLVTTLSFSAFISSTNAETSVYQINKSSSGGGKVDSIGISTSALDFGAIAGTVTIDGAVATVNGWSTGSIGVAVPSQVEGVADVVVTLADGTQLNIGSFVVNPKITSLSPSPLYVTAEETQLTINGEGFTGNTGLVTGGGGSFSTIVSWSDTQIVVKVSKNKPLGIGQQQIVVNNSSSPFPLLVKQAVCDTEDDWACSGWSSCSADGEQTRTCTQEFECDSIGIPPTLTKSCTPPVAATCSSWTYSSWGTCSVNGQQTRTISNASPQGCAGGNPILTQSCTYTPPQPTCTEDTWSCGTWGECSISGIKTRSCVKTVECSSAVTPAPSTSEYCQAPNRSYQTIPSGNDAVINQDTIIKATVKLICPVDDYTASQGSGTVIDSKGTILTNKHVVTGTLGCFVGFIDDYDDKPYFASTHIADIVEASSSQDIAILEMRNPNNKSLDYIDIDGTAVGLSLGDKIMTYGYPAQFGEKITYTSGDFSGTDGGYLKTTAILEHGNSGGGAYSEDGTYIGIPSAAISGELNSMGYILSVDVINAWLNNTTIYYGYDYDNNYSRVSALEDIDLDDLSDFSLFIPETDETGEIIDGSAKTVFSDLASSHKNSDAILYLKSIDMIDGYPGGAFKPDNPINRGELMKVLVEGKSITPSVDDYSGCFPDVSSEWFAPYVCYAKEMGWVDGYPDGSFKPEQTVEKVEAIKMLLNSQGTIVDVAVKSDPFEDVDKNAWFGPFVYKAKELGILEETGTEYGSGDGMTRGGICENLYRLLTY